jgi:LuxR family transcriptional regulator, maltose regulon positive regulatory protein
VIYAPVMSSADEIIARFADHDTTQAPDGCVLPGLVNGATCALTSEAAWGIRRTIVRARSALISMRLDEASKATVRLQRLLNTCSESHATRYASTLRMLQACLLAAKDDLTAARDMLTTQPSLRRDTLAATLLRFIDWKRGEHEETCVPDTVDYLAVPVGGNAVYRILSLCVSAALAFERLQLTVCANLATEAFQLAKLRYGTHSPMSSLPATLLAQVAYEQGRLEEAEALLRSRFAVIRSSGMLECVARASVLLAKLRLHRGQHRAALATLRETEALGRARRWPRLVSLASAEYARALLVVRYDEAHGSESRTAGSSALAGLGGRRYTGFIAGLRSHAQFGSPLRQLLTRPAMEGVPADELLRFSTIETALDRAGSAASDGSLDDGYELLIRCLRIGAARGLRMVFVDAGRHLLALLEGLYYAIPTHDAQLSDLRPYIATLLRSTAQANSADPSPTTGRTLSRRETGVLRMIANGMSNKRIAQSLGITPETVKSHAKSIFVKLATRTRAQAVARAEAIGFL